jgi:hypothetical protein
MTAIATSGGSSVPERPMIGTRRDSIPNIISIIRTAGTAILLRLTNKYDDNEAERRSQSRSITSLLVTAEINQLISIDS